MTTHTDKDKDAQPRFLVGYEINGVQYYRKDVVDAIIAQRDKLQAAVAERDKASNPQGFPKIESFTRVGGGLHSYGINGEEYYPKAWVNKLRDELKKQIAERDRVIARAKLGFTCIRTQATVRYHPSEDYSNMIDMAAAIKQHLGEIYNNADKLHGEMAQALSATETASAPETEKLGLAGLSEEEKARFCAGIPGPDAIIPRGMWKNQLNENNETAQTTEGNGDANN